MSKIRRKIKKIVRLKWFPASLFLWYFNFQNNKKRTRLFSTLNSNSPLMSLIRKEEQEHWSIRIKTVKSCPDNKDIAHDKMAGQIVDNCLIMHNGLKIDPASYYGYGMLELLRNNKGVHEPQEEKIFQEVLNVLPNNSKKTMLELGSYWSFYSMWFLKEHPSATCYMVEPERLNLFYGKRNVALNNLDGTFIHAGIADKENTKENTTTVDRICEKHQIDFLDILHADIQGFELKMLHGSKNLLSKKKVGYIFVSTHSNELHEACRQLLQDTYGFELIASANLDESFSWDGILVMKNPTYNGVEENIISKRKLV